MKRLHLVIYSACAAILTAEFALSAYFWNTLPASIPTHFGISGAPDAYSAKSIWMVFLLPLIQLAMYLLFVFLYQKPQYSNWPTTLILVTVEEKKREKIYEVLRSMLTWVLLWVTLIFGYLQYIIIATANGRANGVMNYVIFGMLAIVLLLVIVINVRMYRTVIKLIKE